MKNRSIEKQKTEKVGGKIVLRPSPQQAARALVAEDLIRLRAGASDNNSLAQILIHMLESWPPAG